MSESLKIATDSLDGLVAHKEAIEKIFEEHLHDGGLPGVDMSHAAKLYTAMYAAVDDCIDKQQQSIELLKQETLSGLTVSEVMDQIIEVNESMEVSAIRFEKADKMINDHFAEVANLLEKGVVK